MRILFLLATTILHSSSGCTQNTQLPYLGSSKIVGGHCEGCEAIFESPVPFEQLHSSDTLPGFNEKGLQLLVHGTVFQKDGKTPAPGVVLYVYHTDQTGIYPKKGNEEGWAQKHGYIRGWIKTDKKGSYSFYTLRPAAYPNSKIAAHIHIIIKEPGKNPYWIDEYVFDDDPLLTKEQRAQARKKGGSGILNAIKRDNLLMSKREIVLGKNIENY